MEIRKFSLSCTSVAFCYTNGNSEFFVNTVFCTEKQLCDKWKIVFKVMVVVLIEDAVCFMRIKL